MKTKRLMISLGLLTLLIAGCTIPKTEEPTDQAQQEPTQQPPGNQPKQDFPEPTEPGTPTVNVSGLIPQTPPEKVTPVVGRQDPFALIPVKPQISIDPEKVKENMQQNTPSGTTITPTSTTIPPVPKPPQSSVPKPPQSSVPQIPKPPSLKIPSIIPTSPIAEREIPDFDIAKKGNGSEFSPILPKLPEPSLAKEVAVTGVIEVAGVPQVILQAPGEPFSRYVRAGDYVSNGQVLVKRVEMNRGSLPVVILEQFGIEVPRQVGQPPEVPNDKTDAPTASLPNVPSIPNG